jgi:hypothetical protein
VSTARSQPVEREIRISAAAWANVLDLSGSTQAFIMLARAPWRAIGLAVLAQVILKLAGLGDPYVGIVLIAFVGIGAMEVLHRRDFVSATHVVRQSGLLGGRRQMIALAEIERVEYSYPRFGRRFHAGDVEVIGQGKGFTFVGVSNPEELAAAILAAREAVIRRGERTASNVPHNNEMQQTSHG